MYLSSWERSHEGSGGARRCQDVRNFRSDAAGRAGRRPAVGLDGRDREEGGGGDDDVHSCARQLEGWLGVRVGGSTAGACRPRRSRPDAERPAPRRRHSDDRDRQPRRACRRRTAAPRSPPDHQRDTCRPQLRRNGDRRRRRSRRGSDLAAGASRRLRAARRRVVLVVDERALPGSVRRRGRQHRLRRPATRRWRPPPPATPSRLVPPDDPTHRRCRTGSAPRIRLLLRMGPHALRRTARPTRRRSRLAGPRPPRVPRARRVEPHPPSGREDPTPPLDSPA
jgi:hypothetical protein